VPERLPDGRERASAAVTVTFNAPGSHSLTIPAGVTDIDVVAIGAAGGP